MTILGLQQPLCPWLKLCSVVFSKQRMKLSLATVSWDPLCLQWEQEKAERQRGRCAQTESLVLLHPTRNCSFELLWTPQQLWDVQGLNQPQSCEIEKPELRWLQSWSRSRWKVRAGCVGWEHRLTISFHKRFFSLNKNKPGFKYLETVVSSLGYDALEKKQVLS